MEILKELIRLQDTVVGLGFFDGVHLAHQELIKTLVNISKEEGLKSVLITFQKSPAERFINNVEYITSNEEKESLISSYGVDYLFELDFDDKMMNLTAEEYLEHVVVDYFAPKYIITGFNHTFGKSKKGTPVLLEEFSKKYNYKYILLPSVEYEGESVSSTRIRRALNTGDVELANSMLNRPYSTEGTVQLGNQIGRTIGFPTANIAYPSSKIAIPFGVYAVSVELENRLYGGMMNYGFRPTIDKLTNIPLMEVNIFDFDENIYNKPIKINLLKWIRAEKKFESLDDLKSQIEKDLKECLKLL